MIRLLLTSAVLFGGLVLAQPAFADHFHRGRHYPPRTVYRPPAYCPPGGYGYGYGYRSRAYASPYRSFYSPYSVHNRYRAYHYGSGYSRGGVSVYGPRGGFSFRF